MADDKRFTELRQQLQKAAKPKLNRDREDEARARVIAADRLLSNASVAELARSYGLGRTGVIKALALAERLGFYEQIDALLVERLLPQATAVYELHLQRGNLDAARDIMFGLGALKKNPEIAVGVMTGDGIEAYRAARNAVPPANGSHEGSAPRLRPGSPAPNLEAGGTGPEGSEEA